MSNRVEESKKFKRNLNKILDEDGMRERFRSNNVKSSNGNVNVTVQMPESSGSEDSTDTENENEELVNPKMFTAGIIGAVLATYGVVKGEIMNIQSGAPGEMLHAALQGNLIPMEHAVVSLPTAIAAVVAAWDILIARSIIQRLRRD